MKNDSLRYFKNPFTLIELLVVIAIIAILAAMLLPALAQARERGKSSKCVSHLKTFGTAVIFYCDTYNDVMPTTHFYSVSDEGVVGAGGNTFWQQAFAALKLVNTAIPSNVLSPQGIFACPTETNGVLGRKDDGSSASVGNTYKGTHYGMNRYLSHKYVTNATSEARLERRKLSKVVKPSATCSIGDKWFYIGRTSGYAQVDLRAYNYLPGERHNGHWNYATLDGGVKSMKGYPCKGSSNDWKDWLWAPTQW